MSIVHGQRTQVADLVNTKIWLSWWTTTSARSKSESYMNEKIYGMQDNIPVEVILTMPGVTTVASFGQY